MGNSMKRSQSTKTLKSSVIQETHPHSVKFECLLCVDGVPAPRGVAIDWASRNVFVSAGDEILIFANSDLARDSAIVYGRRGNDNGCFARPAGLTIVPNKRLLMVADFDNSRIQVFSLSTIEPSSVQTPTHVRTLSLPSSRHPYSIAVDPYDQMLFITTHVCSRRSPSFLCF